MELAGVLLLLIVLVYIVSVLSRPKLEIAKKEEAKDKSCPPHKWQEHELDGHLYCTICKRLPLQEDNGERV